MTVIDLIGMNKETDLSLAVDFASASVNFLLQQCVSKDDILKNSAFSEMLWRIKMTFVLLSGL